MLYLHREHVHLYGAAMLHGYSSPEWTNFLLHFTFSQAPEVGQRRRMKDKGEKNKRTGAD